MITEDLHKILYKLIEDIENLFSYKPSRLKLEEWELLESVFSDLYNFCYHQNIELGKRCDNSAHEARETLHKLRIAQKKQQALNQINEICSIVDGFKSLFDNVKIAIDFPKGMYPIVEIEWNDLKDSFSLCDTARETASYIVGSLIEHKVKNDL